MSNDDIKVNLDLLESFADQLEEQLTAIESSDVPGVGNPMPVGGAPAWEGQALSNAYWYSSQDARDLLVAVREALAIAKTNSVETVRVYRGGDVNSAENNARIAQAIASGQTIGGLDE
jgi:hypothetical protein